MRLSHDPRTWPGRVSGPLLARAYGKRDEDAIQATMAAGVRLYLVVASVIITVGLLLTIWIDRIVPVPRALSAEIHVAWMVSVANFMLLVLSPFKSLADSQQRGYWINILTTLQAFFVAFLSLELAKRGWGVVGQVLALVLGNMLVLLVLAIDGTRRHPRVWREIAFRKIEPKIWKSLWALSPATLLINVCNRLGLLTDYLIIGNLLVDGPEYVTALFLTQRLAVLGQGQLQAVGSAVWSGLAELNAQGNFETFRRRLVELSKLISILGVAGLVPVIVFNKAFFCALGA